MNEHFYSDLNLYRPAEKLIAQYTEMVSRATAIDLELYNRYNVKHGLRNADGTGVLVGLTNVADVVGYAEVDGGIEPIPGVLRYRGIDMREIIRGFEADKRFGFEETAFLLLFGKLPSKEEHAAFSDVLDALRPLPKGFKEEAIIHLPSSNVMNKLARCVLASYVFDPNPDDVSIANVVRQSLSLIAQLPTYAVYGYQAKLHYFKGHSLHMRVPEPGLSTAEHILGLLRPYSAYTRLEAEILDLCLVLHADHGGGNNSTFATHVVSSTLTDTYSAIAAAILSLKGPRHGGASLQVARMMEDVKKHVKDCGNRGEITDYLLKILNKQAFDRSGLIYGFGHAVYKLSDPRAEMLKEKAKQLVVEQTDFAAEFEFYLLVADVAVELLKERLKGQASVCVNVDFYSGFVYRMLGFSSDLYTPLFAIARVPGWSAHRLEELNTKSRIIRPAYKCIQAERGYVPMTERK